LRRIVFPYQPLTCENAEIQRPEMATTPGEWATSILRMAATFEVSTRFGRTGRQREDGEALVLGGDVGRIGATA
jgi:hypothetical protein